MISVSWNHVLGSAHAELPGSENHHIDRRKCPQYAGLKMTERRNDNLRFRLAAVIKKEFALRLCDCIPHVTWPFSASS
jgi:hypothetical protein